MAKNFASLYASANPVIALSQKYFVKLESSRGTLIAPAGTDFLFHLEGASINLTQPMDDSPSKSGRHNQDIIVQKKVGEWTLPLFFMVDTTVVQGVTEIDPAVRVLWKSLLGKETTVAGVVFNAEEDPSITFTMIECGDKFAKQASGCVVEEGVAEFPGDGQSQITFSGRCKDVLNVGIGKSTADNDGANTITLLVPSEAKRFPIGAMVMLIEANGTTRSADTPDGTPRKVTNSDPITGIVTVDGAVLADADGTGVGAPIYLCYYEPVTPTAINNPLTGLVGTVTVDNLEAGTCIRSMTVTMTNNHEYVDYCYGVDSLGTDIFIPGGKLKVAIEMQINMTAKLVEYLNDKRTFDPDAIVLLLGAASGRHVKFDIPKVIYNVPAVEVPASGSVPVTMSGTALQTGTDLGDEIEVSYL